MELVRLVRREGASVSAAAEAFGVSRKTAHKWLARFEEEGRCGLSDRSRAPRTQANQTPDSTCRLLIEMRRRHPRWGPRKIIDSLVLQGWERESLPAASTAGEILRRADLVKPRRRRSPSPVGPGVAA